ncbi:threonylcarbamoyl-AMP synthase [Litoribacter alkaliphilus]|uniref:Threonylcarbamoyl-AMP synthase n=1 Tax=Litoribacter ruber TaxID=702568 RepID=A0AAP2CLA3_9BACT|nr:L-threonylcarbamoyladenylate synthase [Litoribacter alkaliphilus]MBS9523932.1 threonylcarbamoyl-AMP synthase [Litoribacter alkaliphilus]
MAEIGQNIQKAKSLLEQGELVAIPTETVYGLAGNALDAQAVSKIFETKNRPSFDPLIIHVGKIEQVSKYVKSLPEELKKLAEKYWPGPLTLLLPKKNIVPDLVTSGLDQVAIRIPNHPLTQGLLGQLDFPLAAPSANPFGYISPTKAKHVNDQLGDKLAYILDGGECQVGLESTIIGMEEGEIVIYRLGGMDVAEVESVVGPVKVLSHSSSNPKTPGMLKSHYAPRKPFVLGNLDTLVEEYEQKGEDYGVLSFEKSFPGLSADRQVVLSQKGDFKEAAQKLFGALRDLDEAKVSVILAELLPEESLGRAINDRLRRAAAQ